MCACMCVRARVCVSRPFFTFSVPVLHLLRSPVPLPSSLPLTPYGAARPIKESRPTPVCAGPGHNRLSFSLISILRPSAFSFPPQASSRAASHLTPHLFSQASPLATASRRAASRCVSPRNCILHTRPPDGRIVRISRRPAHVKDR